MVVVVNFRRFTVFCFYRFRTVAIKVICVCRKIEEDENDDITHSRQRQLRPSMLMQRSLHEELSRIRRMRQYQQTRAEARLMRITALTRSRDEHQETTV